MVNTGLNIIKFKTNHNSYIYDGVTGEVIPSNNDIEYIIQNYNHMSLVEMKNELKPIKNEINFNYKYEYIKKLFDAGMFYTKNQQEELIDLENFIPKGNSSQLIIVLTERCNLRCEYCVYSEKYPREISYSSKDIDFNTSKLAVDTYFELHRKKVSFGHKKAPMVTFYGGEPLLKFDVIKKVVEYVKGIDKNTKFYITTNGVLLNEEIADFISSNNFFITFSLDGYKENHDRNRVTTGQMPTFEIIYNNILLLQEIKKKKGIKQYISFNCCYDNYTDLIKCAEFFESNYNAFEPFLTMYAPISPFDTNYYTWTKERVEREKLGLDEKAAKISYDKIKDLFYDPQKCNSRFREIVMNLFLSQYAILIRDKWNSSILNNSCIPLSKLAVYPDGTYTLCEKMNKKLPVGDVEHGISYKNIKYYLNLLSQNFTLKKCSKCNVKRFCPACFMYMNDNGDIGEEFCINQQKSIEGRLSELYSLLEIDSRLIEKFSFHDEFVDLMDVNN